MAAEVTVLRKENAALRAGGPAAGTPSAAVKTEETPESAAEAERRSLEAGLSVFQTLSGVSSRVPGPGDISPGQSMT